MRSGRASLVSPPVVHLGRGPGSSGRMGRRLFNSSEGDVHRLDRHVEWMRVVTPPGDGVGIDR